MSDTLELADLAREWGCLWHGHIPFASWSGYLDSGSPGRTMSIGGVSPPSGGLDGGEWDIGGGGNTGGGSGGGWGSGGGGNTGGGGGGGGGWDSGGGGSTGGGDKTVGGGNTGGGGGWDK